MELSKFEKLFQQNFEDPVLQNWSWHDINRFFEANSLPNFQEIIKCNKINGTLFLQIEKEDIKDFFDNPSAEIVQQILDLQQLLRKFIQYLNQRKSTNFKQNLGSQMNSAMSSNMNKSEYDQSIYIPVESNQNHQSVKKPSNNEKMTQNQMTLVQSYIIDYKQLCYNPFDFQQPTVLECMQNLFQLAALAVQFQNLNRIDNNKYQLENQNTQKELFLEPIDLNPNCQKQIKQCYRINKNEASIGKTSDSYIQLQDQSISRSHALIIYKNNQYFLKDKGSTSGTFIRIKDKSYEVQKDMIVECGLTEFEFCSITCSPSKKEADVQVKIIEGYSPQKGQTLQFKVEEDILFVIGKGQQCKISIPNDKYLSDYHAKLSLIHGLVMLDDMNSEYGTWQRLSKQKVISSEYPILTGTQIKINPYIFRVSIQNEFEIKSNGLCILCKKNPSNILLKPCSHNVTCEGCSSQLTVCPILSCSQKIIESTKIYLG